MASSGSSNDRTDYKAQVLAATDIVQLIGQSVALKRRGKDYVGLCPFHSEKTPSFKVSPARQAFYCFGCKASGNAIDFLIKRDRIEFMDALRALGQQAGIEMPRFAGGGFSKEKQGERQALFDAHVAAVTFFENWLKDPQTGAAARDYLAQRGFTAETIAKFHIGVAVDAWDALLRSPVARKFPPPLLATAGLLKARENGGGFYDTFRNRIMFPIRDETGRTIAFGGRVMPESGDTPKYLNSPETPLFNKSKCVFGLDLAKQKIVETRTVAVVEGYTDVMMAHQFGVSNVVSILGTGMTEGHVSILRRFADKIVLLFDADNAGNAAADRVVGLFLTQPIEIAVASMPQGMDPDEFLLEHGPEAFEQVLTSAANVLTYKWKALVRQVADNPNDLTGQQKAVQQYLDLLASARGSGPVDSIRWGMALAQVSKLTGIPIDELNGRFKRKPAGRPQPRPPEVQDVAAADPITQFPPEGGEPNEPLTAVTPARDRAERQILGLLLSEPHRWHSVQVHVHLQDFASPRHRRIAEVYWTHQREEGEPVFNQFLDLLATSAADPRLTELAVELVEEIEGLVGNLEDSEERTSVLDQTLASAIDYLTVAKLEQEQQKLLAVVKRTSEERPSEQDERALFEAFVKNNQSTNLRRLGPVKRSR